MLTLELFNARTRTGIEKKKECQLTTTEKLVSAVKLLFCYNERILSPPNNTYTTLDVGFVKLLPCNQCTFYPSVPFYFGLEFSFT